MRTITEAQVREALGLPADKHLVEVEIDYDGSDFKHSECCVGKDLPAAVHVDYNGISYDDTYDRPGWIGVQQEAFSWQHAPEHLADILSEIQAFSHDDNYLFKVVVNGWYLRYALQDAA
ncbi:hypothetical protein [Nocardia niwae]|uniref:hypothetical protein n=1 Tax=Nocardia niwae TaxID=626084 RepID=UPI0007A43694|nr:hypothetical protein [Nocardia niwae]